MKSILILFAFVAIYALTATQIQSQKGLSYNGKSHKKVQKNKEPHLSFLEHSVQSHLKQSMEKAHDVLDQMVADYLSAEYHTKGKFPFGKEAEEIRKVNHLLPIIQKASSIKSWNLGRSVRLAEVKKKISQKVAKLTDMLHQGYSMVHRMVANVAHSRFISKSLYNSFRKFVSMSVVSGVYKELLESINVNAETSNEIAMEAVTAATEKMTKTKEPTHGTATMNQPCKYHYFSRDSDCIEGLKCSHSSKTCISAVTSRGTKALGDACQNTQCDTGLTCSSSYKVCVDSNGHGVKKLNEDCNYHSTTTDTECEKGLKCSDTTHKCFAKEEFVKEIRKIVGDTMKDSGNAAKITTGLTEAEPEKSDLTDTADKNAASTAVDSTKKSRLTTIVNKFKDIKNYIKEKLKAAFHFVDDWIGGVAIGLEVKGTIAIWTGSASINYAFIRDKDDVEQDNYLYTEVCHGSQANFGATAEIGIVITILHDPLEEGEKEKSKGVSISLEIEAGVIPASFSVGISMNLKKKDSSFEMESISFGIGLSVGHSFSPVTVAGVKCTARRLS